MAPEVLRGERANRQSDLWALGAVLYEMAAGKRPFSGRTAHEISAAILMQPPDPLPSRVPNGLRSIIQKCLTKEPRRRYHSAAEVRAGLDALHLELESRQRPTLARRAATTVGLAVLSVMIIVLGERTRTMLQQQNGASSSRGHDDVNLPFTPKRLAVFPVIPKGAPASDAALTETVVEQLLYRIASLDLSRINVVALPTALEFAKEPGEPLARAREELEADFVATIRVSIRGDHLTFSVSLDETEKRTHMWGNSYERMKSDIFMLQTEVGTQVVEALLHQVVPGTRLSESDRAKLSEQPTQNFSAFELYSAGRRVWYRPTETPAGYQQSIELYDAAIRKDPNFALAYLGKADAIGSLAWEGWMPPAQARAAMEDALKKVDSLAPNLGQAHYTRALLKNMNCDFAAAESEYLAAIRSGDAFPMNRRFYAYFLMGRGRMEAALQVAREALDRDRGVLGRIWRLPQPSTGWAVWMRRCCASTS